VTVEQLEQAFTSAQNNSAAKAIVFQGAGKAFVAGADIKFFLDNIKNNQINRNISFTKKGHDLFLRIEHSAKPTVAVLDGLSLGGGSELALSCQAIVATPAGSMGFPETAIGIYPGLGGMLRLARHVGPELAKYYVFTGKPITASDASALGIITRLTEPQKLNQAIEELCGCDKIDKYRHREIPEPYLQFSNICSGENLKAILSGGKLNGVPEDLAAATSKSISRKAPLALKRVNELIDAQQGKSMEDCIALELESLNYIFSTEDALTGLSSLGGKPPQFVGR